MRDEQACRKRDREHDARCGGALDDGLFISHNLVPPTPGPIAAAGALGLEEERRCFYVALTRAKREVHIYVTKERYSRSVRPSRFLEELTG